MMEIYIVEIFHVFYSLFVTLCFGNIHAPLYRVIPPSIFYSDHENTLKSFQSIVSSSDTKITYMETDLKGVSNYGYYLSVGIGTPPQYFNLIIDTGSSNTAVAGSPDSFLSTYFKSGDSSTFINSQMKLSVSYDSGKWSGTYSSDIFTLDGIAYVDMNKTLKYSEPLFVRSCFGVIKESETFFLKNGNFHGIFGLAYAVLAQPSQIKSKSTLLDDMIKKYSIPNMFSVVLCGYNKSDLNPRTSGFFILGGKNESLYDQPMVDILIHRQWFYEIIISRISIANKPIILSSCIEYNRGKTILDTGTTDTYFSSTVFHSLVSSIIFNMNKAPFSLYQNSPFWERKAAICVIPNGQNHPAIHFPEIKFELVINDTTSLEVALSAQQYIQYVGDEIDFFGIKRNCYKFGFGLSKSGSILGDSFLEGFYLLFNKENNKVGIAQSKCNVHVENFPRSRIIKINAGQQGLLACADSLNTLSFLSQLTPTLAIIVGVLFAVIIFLSLALWVYYRYSAPEDDGESENLIGSNKNTDQNYRSYNSIK